MSYIYDIRKRSQAPQNTDPEPTAAPGPGMDALMRGTARPTPAQKGRSIDLDGAIKAKMEHAFGDLSAVKLYESRAVGEAGAEAIAQGNEIAFAPGMADFSSRSGQERLGHELSHVMSQRSGQVRGQGFLASASLEARADREGAMAAAGERVYTGPVTHALSDASPSPSLAGLMQAKREDDEDGGHQANPVAQVNAPLVDLHVPRVPADNADQLPTAPPLADLRAPRVPPREPAGLPRPAPMRDLAAPKVLPQKPIIMPMEPMTVPRKPGAVAPDLTPEEFAAIKRKQQARQNVDRMYRIQAGMMYGLDEENLNSQEDLDWYETMKETADADTLRELNRRGDVTSSALVDYRDNLEGNDLGQKNYEASWSDPALELDVLSVIKNELINSPGYDQVAMEQQEE